jgi:predicted GNAT family acetyltransferase
MLLAPNGKESNLTPEQYKLVRTPAFKKWFGDWEKLANSKIKDGGIDESTLEVLGRDVSKVVDENGEPLVVYHGTNNNFTIFKLESLIWTTNDLNYITERQSEENSLLGKRLITLFGNADSVLDLTELGYDGINGDKFNEILKKKGVNANYTSSDFKRPYAYLNNYSKAKFLLNYGINAIHIYITKNEKGFAFFNSNQIKLADGTNTTFDSSNPDIRYADGGEIKSKENGDFVQLKYTENGKEIGHLNYYIDLGGVMSNDLDKKPYNFKNEIYIEIVEVDKENRGKGIAKKLLNRAISDAKDLNVDVITLRRDSGVGCDVGNSYDTY